jgi:two-component system, cell cycle response regulator DivK
MAGDLILIVEDNEKNLKLVRDVLQFQGYETLEASTAEEGLAIARARTPTLILMDIQLPGMNGITAFQRLREEPSTRRIPVLALTAQAMTQEREELLAAGFDGFLSKPINLKEFLAVVRKLLDSQRTEG